MSSLTVASFVRWDFCSSALANPFSTSVSVQWLDVGTVTGIWVGLSPPDCPADPHNDDEDDGRDGRGFSDFNDLDDEDEDEGCDAAASGALGEDDDASGFRAGERQRLNTGTLWLGIWLKPASSQHACKCVFLMSSSSIEVRITKGVLSPENALLARDSDSCHLSFFVFFTKSSMTGIACFSFAVVTLPTMPCRAFCSFSACNPGEEEAVTHGHSLIVDKRLQPAPIVYNLLTLLSPTCFADTFTRCLCALAVRWKEKKCLWRKTKDWT